MCEFPDVIPCHFVLATKCGPDGKKLKLHARLVANGKHQEYGVDYFKMFTPMANMSTIHAVLYADIQEDIYMRAPPGYLG